MLTTQQKVRLGVFVTLSTLTVLALIMFFFSSAIFKKFDHYYIRFKDISVSGLDVGSQVKYHGLRIGKVTRMEIDKEDVSTIIVDIAIEKGDSIKSDVRAVITPMGITGLMMIELQGGSNQASYLLPGSFLKTGSSITANITGKAEVIAAKLEKAINNLIDITGPKNRDNLEIILNSGAGSLKQLDEMISENREDIYHSISNISKIIDDTKEITASLKLSAQRLEKISSSEELTESLKNLAEITRAINSVDWSSTMEAFRNAVLNLDRFLNNLNKNTEVAKYDILETLNQFKKITIQLDEFSRKINNNPALLLKGANKNEAKEELPELEP
jgi:phospholipid/cholesterol/gamma-HCH transport system substrate-binding protein